MDIVEPALSTSQACGETQIRMTAFCQTLATSGNCCYGYSIVLFLPELNLKY